MHVNGRGGGRFHKPHRSPLAGVLVAGRVRVRAAAGLCGSAYAPRRRSDCEAAPNRSRFYVDAFARPLVGASRSRALRHLGRPGRRSCSAITRAASEPTEAGRVIYIR
jgi:hypothetical protein